MDWSMDCTRRFLRSLLTLSLARAARAARSTSYACNTISRCARAVSESGCFSRDFDASASNRAILFILQTSPLRVVADPEFLEWVLCVLVRPGRAREVG